MHAIHDLNVSRTASTTFTFILAFVKLDGLRQSGEWSKALRYLDDSSLATRRSKFHCCHEA